MEGFQAVADFLSKEQDFAPLENILKVLNASKIPFVERLGSAKLEHITLAHTAVYSCIPLFRSLLYAQRRSAQLETYTQRCLEKVLEYWDGVIRWMSYIVKRAAKYGTTREVCQDCADALFAILAPSERGENLLKQELVSVPGTARFVYQLLSQTDRRTGQYVILCPYDISDATCSFAQLLTETLLFEENWDAMRLEWESKSSRTRRRYALALIGRVQQLMEMADVEYSWREPRRHKKGTA